VQQAILTEIIRDRLAPGERLYEAKLSTELGVSQATINVFTAEDTVIAKPRWYRAGGEIPQQ
jgi:hypothetical protein